ncbi:MULTISPECIES: glycosyltransferase family 4 protein [unclassified Lentimicrobium]|uniref:glycosyltransferase family 4 protein n=1 Tax=unclassified Lentimicrobium TaxID=2677434 RepID=UPI001552CAD6|nr:MULTISPECIES: glycosyltransferase family 4 protein [unclassified Lentimicrobium]NPD45544.1 glycosyltransferase [Lentimicrobium sp. S6]NPD83623.1 glycosyltransferase [Lentimicrobium sp. L6]
MNILLVNIWLANLTGTEVYIRDLAINLLDRGVDVEVFSPVIGETSKAIRNAGINVVDDIDKLLIKPDLIHAHHYISTMEAICRFPDVPVVYFQHDRIHLVDHPPRYFGIRKYMAVDYNCLDRLLIDNRIEKEKTGVLYNWVDTDRFKRRIQFKKKPLRALVFSNYATSDNHFRNIQEACLAEGIELDGIGSGLGESLSNPEMVLNNYDLIFAKAKAAIEALSSGAAVIISDFRGLGGMVTSENYDQCRRLNFGMKTMTKQNDVHLLREEIRKYNVEENKVLSEKIRNDASVTQFMDALIPMYQSVIESSEPLSDFEKMEDARVIREYKSLRITLFEQKVNQLKELHREELVRISSVAELKKLRSEIRTQAQLLEYRLAIIKNKEDRIEAISKSWSYRIGLGLTFPFRVVYDLLKVK